MDGVENTTEEISAFVEILRWRCVVTQSTYLRDEEGV